MARILRGEKDRSRLARSYSSIRLDKSSSDVIEINASRSSDGSLHRNDTCDPRPHSSPIFASNSENR